MRSTKRNQAGFTLVELLVVIGILGVLSGVTVVGVDVVRTKAEQSACKADAQNLDTAEAADEIERRVRARLAGGA